MYIVWGYGASVLINILTVQFFQVSGSYFHVYLALSQIRSEFCLKIRSNFRYSLFCMEIMDGFLVAISEKWKQTLLLLLILSDQKPTFCETDLSEAYQIAV